MGEKTGTPRFVYAGHLAEGELSQVRFVALREAGVSVHPFDMSPHFAAVRKNPVRRALRRLRGEYSLPAMNRDLIAACDEFDPDVLYVDKGTAVTREALRAIRERSEARGRRIVLLHFHPDDAFNPIIYTETYGQALGEYDCHFIPHPWVLEQHLERGARKAVDFPYGYQPAHHFRDPDVTPGGGAEVAFVGRWEEERGGWLAELARSGVRVEVWGPGWERELARGGETLIHRAPWASFEEQRQIYGSASISLVLLSSTNRDGHTSRTFEVPACGGFMLAERTSGQAAFFRDGEEMGTFKGAGEMSERVRYYLAHPRERERIREAGHRRCISSGYDYGSRMRFVVEEAKKLLLQIPQESRRS